MPTSLTATKIKDTYGQLLHVDGGITSTLKTIYDGDGTATGLKISTTGIDPTSVTLTSGTANGVAYLNGSKVVTTGSALTFDGSRLSVGAGTALNVSGYNNIVINGSTGGLLELKSNDTRVLQIQTDGASAGAQISTVNNGSNPPLIFGVNSSEQMRLTSTGLGIGTSSPLAKLQVSGGRSYFFSGSEYSVALAQTAGQGNYMYLGTNTSGDLLISESGGSARATLTQSGNLGLGVTPSAHAPIGFGGPMLQVGNRASLLGSSVYSTLTNNVYYANGFYRYIGSDTASMLEQSAGAFRFFTAPSGTAGNAISFTQAMTLDASGNLGIGTSSPSAGLDLLTGNVTTAKLYSSVSNKGGVVVGYNSASTNYYDADTQIFRSGSATERMRIDSSGNVGIGTSSPSRKLTVYGSDGVPFLNVNGYDVASWTSATLDFGGITASQWNTLRFFTTGAERMRLDSSGNLGLGVTPSAWGSGRTALQLVNGAAFASVTSNTYVGNNWYNDGTNNKYIASAFATLYGQNTSGQHVWYTAPSGTAGNAISFTQAMTLDASGNLALGLSGASYRFDMSGTATAGMTVLQQIRTGTGNSYGFQIKGNYTTEDYLIQNYYNGYLAFGTNNAERMRIDSSGNVGIGTSSPSTRLYVDSGSVGQVSYFNSTHASGAYITVANSGTACLLLGSASNLTSGTLTDGAVRTTGNMVFATGGGYERMRIDSSGNLLVGKTAANDTTQGSRIGLNYISSAGTTDFYLAYSTTSSVYRFYVSQAGTVFATNTTISAISDQRFKENVRDLDVGLDAVMALKPRKFDWKSGKGKDIKNDRGFIAQEFEQVFPDLIDEWKDPAPEGEEPYKSVRQDLIPVLVKAIQELKAELDATKAEVAALKG